MKAETRRLLKENNEREKAINSENNKIYTDMIVYLRGSQLTMFNQEQVRADFINMIIDGQNRNDDINAIMGRDYKKVCDEIIDALPPKTTAQKVWGTVSTASIITSIILFIWTVQDIIYNAVDKNELTLSITTGRLVGGLLIVAAAIVIVEMTCRHALSDESRMSTFKLFWVFFAIFGCIVAVMYLLQTELCTIPFYISFVISAAGVVITKITGNVADY